jgi:hypothetical protein
MHHRARRASYLLTRLCMICRSHRVGLGTLLLGLLFAFSGIGCKAPTGPTDEERAAVYTGRWAGNINDLRVTLDIRATWGGDALSRGVHLDGTGTALNPATGEMHQLTIFGSGNSSEESRLPASFFINIAREIGPGGVILSGGQRTGEFRGDVLRDGQTWPGRFTSTAETHPAIGALIFGPGEHSVTLTK